MSQHTLSLSEIDQLLGELERVSAVSLQNMVDLTTMRT